MTMNDVVKSEPGNQQQQQQSSSHQQQQQQQQQQKNGGVLSSASAAIHSHHHHQQQQSHVAAAVATAASLNECAGCKKRIGDRFMLKALELFWHEDCLKCACCDCRLGEVGSTLFTKANLILCKRDYLRLFGTTGYCSACSKMIPAFEMVMRARGNVYHLECFACQQCNHRFCVGDRFYLCDNKILCEYDYEERMVFANMPYTYNSIAHIKRQTQNLAPPPPHGAQLSPQQQQQQQQPLPPQQGQGQGPPPQQAPPPPDDVSSGINCKNLCDPHVHSVTNGVPASSSAGLSLLQPHQPQPLPLPPSKEHRRGGGGGGGGATVNGGGREVGGTG